MRLRAPAALLVLLLASACADPSGAGDASGGTVVVASSAEVDVLVPAVSATTSGQAVLQQLFDRLADLGDDVNTIGDRGFRPHLARSWVWSKDSLQIAFTLDPKARWHDGPPVTARDVRFTFQLYTDPLTGAPFGPLLANIDSVSVRDSLTAVFWFKRRSPEQFFDATYQMLIHPEHLLGKVPHDSLRQSPFGRAPVGSGRFRFAQWEPDVKLVIASDTLNYAGRAKLDRVIFVPSRDYQVNVTRMLTGEADVLETVRPEVAPQFAGRSDLRTLQYSVLAYGFLEFALHDNGGARPHPVFGNATMRRALMLALDRTALVRAVFDSLATVPVGPAPGAISPRDTGMAQPAANPAEADRLLDSLGWARGADGMRKRFGRSLAFNLMIPAPVRTRVQYATLIQAALKERGVAVNIESLDPPTFTDRLNRRAFDATILALSTDPTLSSIRQSWGAAGATTPMGSNHSGYANPLFDRLADSAAAATNPVDARVLWARAFRVINADVPAIWLYEPRPLMALHVRIQPTRVLPTHWLTGLADWSIPAGQRLPRDRASGNR